MIAFVMLASFALGEFMPGACPDSAAIASIVKVKLIQNQPIQVRRAGQTSWLRAEKGTRLCIGDQVRSRYRSRARVRVTSSENKKDFDVVIGVNTRIRLMPPSGGATSAHGGDEAVLEVLHGVVRLKAEEDDHGKGFYVKTGPSVCCFRGDRILSNWDPFKREANHLVVEGSVSCVFADSTLVLSAGSSLEIISGEPQQRRSIVPLLLEAFSNATDF